MPRMMPQKTNPVQHGACTSNFAVLAGVDAQQAVRWAPADQACSQRHQTQPAPDTDLSRRSQRDKNQTDHDAQDAFNAANVCGHESSFGVEKSGRDAVALFGNGLCQRFACLLGIDFDFVVRAVNDDFGLRIHGQQSLGHCFFAVATRHAFNSENLVHDVTFR